VPGTILWRQQVALACRFTPPFDGITDSFLLPFFRTELPRLYNFRGGAHALAAFVPLTSVRKAFDRTNSRRS
jgi:hypothetical protein